MIKPQNVFIIGATGNVGRTLVSQIYEKDTNSNHQNPTRIIGLASRTNFIFDSDRINEKTGKMFSNREFIGEWYTNKNRFLEVVKPLRRRVIFIDVTNGKKDMLDFHLFARQLDYGIVTANKNPLVDCNFETFKELTKDVRRYGYRCSVMAGAEAVNKIRDLRDLGDTPIEISGCFSGTLGYICSELEKGHKFSEIILKAKDLGYTEPNPSEDLSGDDVFKKILILARTAGYDPKKEDMKLNSFIPEKYLSNNLEKLIKNLTEFNLEFSNDFSKALANNMTYRYIASFKLNGEQKIETGLKKVPRNSPLGSLNGTANKILIKTKEYDYLVESPGAGPHITAQNIRRDLLDQIDERVVNYQLTY